MNSVKSSGKCQVNFVSMKCDYTCHLTCKVKLWLKIEKCLAFITNSKPTKKTMFTNCKHKYSQNFGFVYQLG